MQLLLHHIQRHVLFANISQESHSKKCKTYQNMLLNVCFRLCSLSLFCLLLQHFFVVLDPFACALSFLFVDSSFALSFFLFFAALALSFAILSFAILSFAILSLSSRRSHRRGQSILLRLHHVLLRVKNSQTYDDVMGHKQLITNPHKFAAQNKKAPWAWMYAFFSLDFHQELKC